MNNKVVILDTTLRDGEQSPGVHFTIAQKVKIALMLEKLGVDVIEAGYAATSNDEFEAMQKIAMTIKNTTICGLTRAIEQEIDTTANAIKHANSFRIHIVLATSPLHMKYKLQKEPEQVLAQAVAAVKYARRYTDNIEFSCEDAGRSDYEFLAPFIESVIASGATTVSLPDTVGYTVPEQYASLVNKIITNVPNAHKAIISAHCHNDLGLAVANTLAALKAGAKQIECTINGIGERAGNAPLEEIVMALKTRYDYFNLETSINTKLITKASNLIAKYSGITLAKTKAIVGENVYSHESGIHQDGILKNPLTYQIINPADVGAKPINLVLGKYSGRSGFREYLKKLHLTYTNEDFFNAIFYKYKLLIASKKQIKDKDIIDLFNNATANLL